MDAFLIKSLCCLSSANPLRESCALHSCLNKLHSYRQAVTNFIHEQANTLYWASHPEYCTKRLAAYFCPSMLYHQETWMYQCLVMSAVFPQALVMLPSSAAYLGVVPIVYYVHCCSRQCLSAEPHALAAKLISLEKECTGLANLIRNEEGITTPEACGPLRPIALGGLVEGN